MSAVNVLVLSNEESDKTIGVMIHDPQSGRVLLKVRPSDKSLMQTFALWRDRPLIEQVRQEIKGRKITRRLRALPKDQAYAKLLADKFVKKPYRVRFSSIMQLDSLDHALDKLYADFVEKSVAVKPEEVILGGWRNPFATPQR